MKTCHLWTGQGHTVGLRQGHQAMERKIRQQEMVTVVAEVEVRRQMLIIKNFVTSLHFKKFEKEHTWTVEKTTTLCLVYWWTNLFWDILSCMFFRVLCFITCIAIHCGNYESDQHFYFCIHWFCWVQIFQSKWAHLWQLSKL